MPQPLPQGKGHIQHPAKSVPKHHPATGGRRSLGQGHYKPSLGWQKLGMCSLSRQGVSRGTQESHEHMLQGSGPEGN